MDVSLKFHVIASQDTWIEGEAIRQLEATAEFPGMLRWSGCLIFILPKDHQTVLRSLLTGCIRVRW